MGVSLDNLNDYSEQNIQNLVLACAIYSIAIAIVGKMSLVLDVLRSWLLYGGLMRIRSSFSFNK